MNEIKLNTISLKSSPSCYLKLTSSCQDIKETKHQEPMPETIVSTAKGIENYNPEVTRMLNLHISTRGKKEKDSKMDPLSNEKYPHLQMANYWIYLPYLIYIWWLKKLPVPQSSCPTPPYFWSPRTDPKQSNCTTNNSPPDKLMTRD